MGLIIQRLRAGEAHVGIVGAIEQATQSLAHFALTVLVSRWQGPAALSAFAFGYALLLVAYSAFSSCLGEAFSISDERAAANGAGSLAVLSLAMAALMGVGLTSANLIWHGVDAWGLGGAVFVSTLFWAQKIYLYRIGRAVSALKATFIYSIALISGFALIRAQPLKCIAASGLIALAPSAIDFRWPKHLKQPVGRLLRSACGYGKWALPASLLIWFANNGYFVMVPLLGRTDGAAALRAALNVAVPINTLVVGATNALMPRLSQGYRQGGSPYLRRQAISLSALALGPAVLVSAVLALGSHLIIETIYGVNAPLAYVSALEASSCLPVVWVVALIHRASIRAAGRPNLVLFAYVVTMLPIGGGLMVYTSYLKAGYVAAGFVAIQAALCCLFVGLLHSSSSKRWLFA